MLPYRVTATVRKSAHVSSTPPMTIPLIVARVALADKPNTLELGPDPAFCGVHAFAPFAAFMRIVDASEICTAVEGTLLIAEMLLIKFCIDTDRFAALLPYPVSEATTASSTLLDDWHWSATSRVYTSAWVSCNELVVL